MFELEERPQLEVNLKFITYFIACTELTKKEIEEVLLIHILHVVCCGYLPQNV